MTRSLVLPLTPAVTPSCPNALPDGLPRRPWPPNEFPFAIAAGDRTVVTSELAKDPRYSFLAGVERSTDFAVTVDPESNVLCRPNVPSDSHAARAVFFEQVRSVGVPVFRITTVFERTEQVASAPVE